MQPLVGSGNAIRLGAAGLAAAAGGAGIAGGTGIAGVLGGASPAVAFDVVMASEVGPGAGFDGSGAGPGHVFAEPGRHFDDSLHNRRLLPSNVQEAVESDAQLDASDGLLAGLAEAMLPGASARPGTASARDSAAPLGGDLVVTAAAGHMDSAPLDASLPIRRFLPSNPQGIPEKSGPVAGARLERVPAVVATAGSQEAAARGVLNGVVVSNDAGASDAGGSPAARAALTAALTPPASQPSAAPSADAEAPVSAHFDASLPVRGLERHSAQGTPAPGLKGEGTGLPVAATALPAAPALLAGPPSLPAGPGVPAGATTLAGSTTFPGERTGRSGTGQVAAPAIPALGSAQVTPASALITPSGTTATLEPAPTLQSAPAARATPTLEAEPTQQTTPAPQATPTLEPAPALQAAPALQPAPALQITPALPSPAHPTPAATTPQQPLTPQLAAPLFALASAGPGEHVMTLRVTPEDLGPLTVRAHIDGTGVRIELFAPGDAGRDAVRHVLPELRRSLEDSGASLSLSSQNSPMDTGKDPGPGNGSTTRDPELQPRFGDTRVDSTEDQPQVRRQPPPAVVPDPSSPNRLDILV